MWVMESSLFACHGPNTQQAPQKVVFVWLVGWLDFEFCFNFFCCYCLFNLFNHPNKTVREALG